MIKLHFEFKKECIVNYENKQNTKLYVYYVYYYSSNNNISITRDGYDFVVIFNAIFIHFIFIEMLRT